MNEAKIKYEFWSIGNEILDKNFIRNYVNELEQQKAELVQLLKEIDENVLIERPYEYLHYRNKIAELINGK